MDIAGKTGTTTDSKDLWFVGYTPYLTAGIWLGYDQAYQMEGQLSESEHEILWGKIMGRIDSECGYEPTSFTVPDSVGTRTVCSNPENLSEPPYVRRLLNILIYPRSQAAIATIISVQPICNVCGGIANENSKETSYKEYSSASQIPNYSCKCPPETESVESTNSETPPTTTPSTEPPITPPTTPADPTAPTPVG